MNVRPEEVAKSVLRFLKDEIQDIPNGSEFKEGLEVAIDCIAKAYKVEDQDCSTAHDIVSLIQRSKAEFNPQLAEKYRVEGNVFMSQNKFLEALECYDKAIAHEHSNHIHFGNRSAANLKLERYVHAADDANISVNLNPKFHKGYARKGIALMALGDYINAKIAFQKAVELDPENPTYKEKLDRCKAKLNPTSTPNVEGLTDLLSNPTIIDMAQNVMQNPQFQQMFSGISENLQSNPTELSSMMNAFESAMQNLQQNNPELIERFQDILGRPPTPENQ